MPCARTTEAATIPMSARSAEQGRGPARRDVHGIVLLDKPPGLSSNAALQSVKRLYRARKAGHTGSLDPLATGMLPLCFGEATKFSTYLLEADKVYRFEVQLGVTTRTDDAEGEVLERRPVPVLDPARVRAVLDRFLGEIEQVPPMYSALHHQGRRLYELAREGVEVERSPRRVTIHALDLLALERDRVRCEVRCSKGTYVRTLAADIGRALGCGGHVAALRRVSVTPFESHAMVTLEALQAAAERGDSALDSMLLPPDSALVTLPCVELGADAAHYFGAGQPVLVPRAPTSGRLRVYQADGSFLGVGEVADDGRVAPRRLVRLAARMP